MLAKRPLFDPLVAPFRSGSVGESRIFSKYHFSVHPWHIDKWQGEVRWSVTDDASGRRRPRRTWRAWPDFSSRPGASTSVSPAPDLDASGEPSGFGPERSRGNPATPAPKLQSLPSSVSSTTSNFLHPFHPFCRPLRENLTGTAWRPGTESKWRASQETVQALAPMLPALLARAQSPNGRSNVGRPRWGNSIGSPVVQMTGFPGPGPGRNPGEGGLPGRSWPDSPG